MIRLGYLKKIRKTSKSQKYRVSMPWPLLKSQQAAAAPLRPRLNRIATAIQEITTAREQLPAWLIVEITPRANFWLDELDRHIEAGDNAIVAQEILPPFFDVLGLPDAQARKARLAQRSVQILMKSRRHAPSLPAWACGFEAV